MKKKVLVILGHPDADSFCAGLFQAYIDGAKEGGAEVREVSLRDLSFDPVLWKGYAEVQELEPDLVRVQRDIAWADHLVWIYPTWWGTMPTLMKGFLDRALLPGFGFKFRENSPLWDKLLSGRTAEILVTMDTPTWFYRWVYRRPGYHQMKRTILGFCGIRLKRFHAFSPVKGSSREKRDAWLRKAREFGENA